MDPFVAVMRRYVLDYMNDHNPAVCTDIMEPGYMLHIGDHVMAGRDEAYVPAVVGQFEQFPDLRLTVHELVTSGERLALRFSEQGTSVRHGGRAASWAGVALYMWNGSRLTETFAEEDYFSRRRQLSDGVCDPVETPSPSPWEAIPQRPNAGAETAVRQWLEAPTPVGGGPVVYDDSWTGRPPATLVDVASVEVHDLFSAGERVAFHVLQRGAYAGGLAGLEDRIGSPVGLHSAGIVTVDGASVVSGRVVRDRLGLQRSLAPGR